MIDVQQADGVTTVRIDHPPVNALDLGLVDDAVATVRSIDGPIVLTGAGSCFSAGVDLRAILDGGADYSDRFLAALSAAFLAVFDHPFPVAAPEICRYSMGPSVTRAVLQADNVDVLAAAQRGWIDEVVAPDDLLIRAVEIARALGQHPATAYAPMKSQLHRHARAAIDAGAELDANVREIWKSAETRARIAAFLDALK